MIEPLPIVVKPIVGESANSFLSRLADANDVPLRSLTKLIADDRVPANWTNEAWKTLARLSKVEIADLTPLRRPKASGLAHYTDAVTFLGHPIRASYLVFSKLRICPHCVQERRMFREIWNLSHAPVCLDHEVELVDTCSCGRALDFRARGSAGALTCICGRSFGDISNYQASEAALDAARWLLIRLSSPATAREIKRPEQFPLRAPFSTMPFADLVSVIDLVGIAASTPPEHDEAIESKIITYPRGDTRNRRTVALSIGCVEAAMPVLQDWPGSYFKLLDQIASRSQPGDGKSAAEIFGTRIGRMVLRPYRGLDHLPIGCLADAITTYCTKYLGIPARKRVTIRRSRTARVVASTANHLRLAKELGAARSDPIFQRSYDAALRSLDARSDVSDERLADMLRDEVQRRWALACSTMSADKVSLHLDHPNFSRDITPWIDDRLLTPVPQVNELHPRRRKDSFATKDVFEMRRRIARIAKVVTPSRIPPGYKKYGQLSKTLCGGGYYRRTAMILDILSGRIPCVTTISEPRLCDLFLKESAALDASLAARAASIIERDCFWPPEQVILTLSAFWPGAVAIPSRPHFRLMRETTVVRARKTKSRQLYHYSMVDFLERQCHLSGPPAWPSVAALIIDHDNAKRLLSA